MPRYVRKPEDDIDRKLIARGWEMAGMHGWKHPAANNVYHTKDQAIEVDLSDYHPIAIEHEKMLAFLHRVAMGGYYDAVDAAENLLQEMGYD